MQGPHDEIVILARGGFEQGGEGRSKEVARHLHGDEDDELPASSCAKECEEELTEKAGVNPVNRSNHAQIAMDETKAHVPSTVLVVPGQRMRPRYLPTMEACSCAESVSFYASTPTPKSKTRLTKASPTPSTNTPVNRFTPLPSSHNPPAHPVRR